MNLLSLLAGSGQTGTDSPNGLVSNDALGKVLSRKGVESLHLAFDNFLVGAIDTLLLHFANAEDWSKAIGKSLLELGNEQLVVLAVVLATLRVTEDDILGTRRSDHVGSNLACIGALLVSRAILGTNADDATLDSLDYRCYRDEWSTNDNVAIDLLACKGLLETFSKCYAFLESGIHLPVAGYDFLTHFFRIIY